MNAARYSHVDVFATRPLTGNGLTVFLDANGWGTTVMQELTQEMRQFESIFLSEMTPTGARARIFTVEEELSFAGHPVLGAAAVLHREYWPTAAIRTWDLKLSTRRVPVTTVRQGGAFIAEMNQGIATKNAPVGIVQLAPLLDGFGLALSDLKINLPAQVVSTGLPYLILPVSTEALARASIRGNDLEEQLAKVGAKFAFLLDPDRREVRTWDNMGRVEDVATGSAAGPAASYLFEHGLADPTTVLDLSQGRFAGRPSQLRVRRDEQGCLYVSGEVWPVARGVLEIGVLGSSGEKVTPSL